MGRFADVRAALRDDERFLSGHGVAANRIANHAGRLTTLSSDHDVHGRRRKVLMQSLGAKALGPIEGTLQAQAERIVDARLDGRPFDAVTDLASGLPVSVVADLVGVRVNSDQMLGWAASTFNALGPANRRTVATLRGSLGLLAYTRRLSRDQVVPGTWAASVFDAADRGEISAAEARTMVIDFVAPSLDTTILATAHLLWLLGQHPALWQRIREEPELIPAVVVEAVRLASPIRGFTRTLAQDAEIGGTELRSGDRVALLFGAANLDERQFPDPERFDPERPKGAHLGWGNGPHTCVGIHLAKLEMRTLLHAMVPRVQAIHVQTPQRLRNNTLQGITKLPARIEPVAR
ncbi:MAG: cytochrome P450, partial [Solirubrobacteraceae bacterium]|nr:cytochrome P450 [Solirubrobacteraceae bacterium]